MKKQEFFNIGLPKWPALVVMGKPVTTDEAKEILIRTDSLYFSTNDRDFEKELNEFFYDLVIEEDGWGSEREAILKKLGLDKDDKNSWDAEYKYKDEKRAEVRSISLSYLSNNRIASSWIGGPHGWCNWSGDVFCRNYNIGKWPSVEDVYKDWKKIAEEFPFLDLRCQLMNHEAGSEDMVDDPKPVIEFRVKKGKVKMLIPKKVLIRPDFGGSDITERFMNPFAERGCTIDKFKESVEYTKKQVLLKKIEFIKVK